VQAKGFTLIELISVIVILGVLSAFALPKFANLSDQAQISVTKAVQSSFYTAAKQLHLQWAIEAEPSIVVIDGINVLMSATGYPDRSAANSAGCAVIWNSIMDTTINIVVYPGAVAVEEWSALAFGPACVYINHGGTVFVNTSTPFFSYFPSTGIGVGFNLD
jgi:prepilin-type N-terminal cleavage/methylation domain-containing protein